MKKIITLLIFSSAALSGQELIKQCTITPHRVEISCNNPFQSSYLKEPFFAEYPSIDLTALDQTIVQAPFLLAAMPIIWYSGKTYTIDAMDADLYDSCRKIREIFKLFWPKASWNGQLIPEKLIRNRPTHSQGTGVLFSGGLDAICASLTHYEASQLLICCIGGDVPLSNKQMQHGVQQQVEDFALLHKKEHAFAYSNFMRCFNTSTLFRNVCYQGRWWATTSQALRYVGLALPLVYTAGYTSLQIGSSRTIDYPYPYGTHPAIDNLIECAGIKAHHENDTLTRPMKIKALDTICQEQHLPFPQLRVCWGKDPHGGNCGLCRKCTSTILAILIAGLEPNDFGFSYDLKHILEAAKKAFIKTSPKSGIRWQWQELNKVWLEEKSRREYAPELQSFFAWLSKQSMPEMDDRPDKSFFADLWRLATLS